MKHLRRFNENLNSIGQDLQDILLEINDESLWKAESWYEEKWIVIIRTVDEDEEYEKQNKPKKKLLNLHLNFLRKI